MKHKKALIISLALIVGIVILVIVFNRPDPITVALVSVDRGKVESSVANTRAGTVMACQRAKLSPAIGGQIARLPVKEGDQVEPGQVLLEMWNDDRVAEMELARREARAAQARAVEACTIAEVAGREAKRLSTLKKKGLASDDAVDKAQGDAKARKAACDAARANARVSDARGDVAQANLNRTRLTAPFAGTVAEINGEIGEFVTPSPIGIATPPAVDLVDNSCLYVQAPIDEVDAPAIRAGMYARITLDAFPNREFKARVRRVAPYVLDREKQARTVDIEVEFDDVKSVGNLLPGYSADTEVVLQSRENILRIPTESLLEGNRVLVFKEGKLEQREIKVGLSNWRFTEVLDGINEGEQVTTSLDKEGVEDGASVKAEKPATSR